MSSAVDVPTPSVRGVRGALLFAIIGSAVAGLIHGAAVRTHEGDRTLMWMFALCAAAQIGCAAALMIRPAARRILALALFVNGGALLVWTLTRTVGIGFVDSLAEVEAVGSQDLAAVLFAAASVSGAVCMLARPAPRIWFARGGQRRSPPLRCWPPYLP